MTSFHDDGDEMPRTATLDERSIEAILAGDQGAEHPMLTAFVADVRRLGAGPVPQPSLALSTIFLHGISTEKGDLRATAASNVDGPAPQVAGLPKWRRKFMLVKHFIAGLSVVGKLTFGVGAAAAASGGAGTVGVLPDPLQHQFAETFDGIAPSTSTTPGPVATIRPMPGSATAPRSWRSRGRRPRPPEQTGRPSPMSTQPLRP